MTVLTAPGDLHTVNVGRITLGAQIGVDGGYTIHVWAGTNRTSFTYTDRKLARRRYDQIRQMARTGLTAEEIADSIGSDREHAVAEMRQLIDDAAQVVAADPSPDSGRATVLLADATDGTLTAGERADLDALAADISKHLSSQDRVEHDDAAAYGAQLAAGRHAAIDNALANAGRPNTLAAYVGNPRRANTPRLGPRTSRKLTGPMLDMLAAMHANGDWTRLDNATAQNRAYKICKRGNYLRLLYETPGVEATLYAAELTDAGRKALADAGRTLAVTS